MNKSFFVSTDIFSLIISFFIVLVCFSKQIFLYYGGTKFSIVKLEVLFFVTFLSYNLLYFLFVFMLLAIKNKIFYYDYFLVDKAFRVYVLFEIYSTIDVYFLLIIISCCSSFLFLSLNIFEEYEKDKFHIFCLYFLIYFIYWFLLFSCTFFLLLSFFIE